MKKKTSEVDEVEKQVALCRELGEEMLDSVNKYLKKGINYEQVFCAIAACLMVTSAKNNHR